MSLDFALDAAGLRALAERLGPLDLVTVTVPDRLTDAAFAACAEAIREESK